MAIPERVPTNAVEENSRLFNGLLQEIGPTSTSKPTNSMDMMSAGGSPYQWIFSLFSPLIAFITLIWSALEDVLVTNHLWNPSTNVLFTGSIPTWTVLPVFGAVFGGLHLLAWNFIYPSHAEKLIWRITSLIIILTPPVSVDHAYVPWAVMDRRCRECKRGQRCSVCSVLRHGRASVLRIRDSKPCPRCRTAQGFRVSSPS